MANIINTDEAKKIADVKVENIKSKMTALIDEIDKSAWDPSVDGMFTFEWKTFDLYYQYYNDEFFDLITKNKANIVAELKKRNLEQEKQSKKELSKLLWVPEDNVDKKITSMREFLWKLEHEIYPQFAKKKWDVGFSFTPDNPDTPEKDSTISAELDGKSLPVLSPFPRETHYKWILLQVVDIFEMYPDFIWVIKSASMIEFHKVFDKLEANIINVRKKNNTITDYISTLSKYDFGFPDMEIFVEDDTINFRKKGTGDYVPVYINIPKYAHVYGEIYIIHKENLPYVESKNRDIMIKWLLKKAALMY